MPSTVKIQVSFIIVNYNAREQEKVLKDSRKKKKKDWSSSHTNKAVEFHIKN